MNNNNILKIYLNMIKEDADNIEDVEASETVDTEAAGGVLNSLIKEYKTKESLTKDDIVALLNIAICDELLASFNYMISYSISKTEGKADFDDEFKAHEAEEKEHADKIIQRLREMDAEVLTIKWEEYIVKNSCGPDWKQETSDNSKEILLNRYKEELSAIKFYSMILDCIHRMKEEGEEFDSTTERLIKSIKNDEEEHELDLRDLLVQYGVEIPEEEEENLISNPSEDEDLDETEGDESDEDLNEDEEDEDLDETEEDEDFDESDEDEEEESDEDEEE